MLNRTYTTSNGKFSIQATEEDTLVTLKWLGKSTSLYPSDFLNPIFDEVLLLNKKIIMNFTKLEFLTSSTLTPIIKLLNKIATESGQIEIQYKADEDWQDLTFSALDVFTSCDRIQINSV